MRLGIDVLLADEGLRKHLKGRRVAVLGHPASVIGNLTHSLDALLTKSEITVSSAFGPQHGMRGEKQYNMIESEDYKDPRTGVAVFSLYGKVRRPTPEMLDTFDVILYDLQDVGCRIYTYLATLLYILEECAKAGKAVWVLDRPNPVGRPIEGSTLRAGWESFVGSVSVPMRHGLTMGEMGHWILKRYNLKLEYRVIAMQGYDPTRSPGYGWPVGDLTWVNPSPNIPTLSTARCYPGTVLLEGTSLCDGRGTTKPLQIFGAPKIDAKKVLEEMHRFAPHWMDGCRLRECFFEPTFYKYKGELCSGLQIHVDDNAYKHESFKPYRLILSFLKALHKLQPDTYQWREPGYEYDFERLPIDLLNGGTQEREWVDDPRSTAADLEALLSPDETRWAEERREFLLYPV